MTARKVAAVHAEYCDGSEAETFRIDGDETDVCQYRFVDSDGETVLLVEIDEDGSYSVTDSQVAIDA